jgi:hypothetical protein
MAWYINFRQRSYPGPLQITLWRIDPFLGNNRETNNKTTAVARQQILKKQQLNYNDRGTVGNGVFYSVHAKRLYNEDTSNFDYLSDS